METTFFKTQTLVLGFALSAFAYMYNADLVSTNSSKNFTTAKVAAVADEAPFAADNVEFDFDRSTIRPESYAELDRVASQMIADNAGLKLGGHADNIGEYVYNWKLSKARADAVKAYLVSKGADSSRIAATEYGDTKPIASNETDEGRQRNRRVEVTAY